MPLKVSVVGPRYSGKRSVCKLLNQKYGLTILDVDEIIKEALVLANPPVEDENTKKKAKKDDKNKVEEKKENLELK